MHQRRFRIAEIVIDVIMMHVQARRLTALGQQGNGWRRGQNGTRSNGGGHLLALQSCGKRLVGVVLFRNQDAIDDPLQFAAGFLILDLAGLEAVATAVSHRKQTGLSRWRRRRLLARDNQVTLHTGECRV